MTYDEMKSLSIEMARDIAVVRLQEMFVERPAAIARVEAAERARTQDWLRDESAMFDALVALKDLGYGVVKVAPKA